MALQIGIGNFAGGTSYSLMDIEIDSLREISYCL